MRIKFYIAVLGLWLSFVFIIESFEFTTPWVFLSGYFFCLLIDVLRDAILDG